MTELRAWIKDVGFPIAVAVALLGLLLKAVPELITKVDALTVEMRAHEAAAGYSRRAFEHLLRRICINGAKDGQGELACWDKP